MPGALAITDRLHAFGADLGVVLGDLLDLVHTLTRLRSVPDLRDGLALPEADRVRGAALADTLTVPELARLWQMLLKRHAGGGDRPGPPRRRRDGADPAVPRCRAADAGRVGEAADRRRRAGLAARRQPTATPAGAGARHGRRRHRGRLPDPDGAGAAAAGPARRAHWRASATWWRCAPARDPTLHAHLRHAVHLVRFSPGVIELRPDATAPRDLAPRLAALLLEATGARWTIALSSALGEPTLGQQGEQAEAARRTHASDHPLVRAILAEFPGATLGAVRDASVDAYGLPPPVPLGEPDMPAFIPPDAERKHHHHGGRRVKNLAGLMKQASQMQSKMAEMQAKLEEMEIEGSSGAGMVTVVLSGKGDAEAGQASTPSWPTRPRSRCCRTCCWPPTPTPAASWRRRPRPRWRRSPAACSFPAG